MIFFVFSYNRAPHLANCIASIEDCCHNPEIVVYDDRSDDPETIETLSTISHKHTVITPAIDTALSQHGSLYANMQRALDSIAHRKKELVFFLQDDTQLVRPIDSFDIEFIDAYFSKWPRAAFLAPVFQKRITRKRVRDRFVYDASRDVYFCEHTSKKNIAGVYYSDISITRTDRLNEAGWFFGGDEYQNEQRAKELFDKMGYLASPLVMWLPNPPAYRNKTKNFTFILAEKINKPGLYPFEIMDSHEIDYMRKRAGKFLPIAEDYLTVSSPALKRPWIYHPLRRSRLLRKLNRLEEFLRSIWRK